MTYRMAEAAPRITVDEKGRAIQKIASEYTLKSPEVVQKATDVANQEPGGPYSFDGTVKYLYDDAANISFASLTFKSTTSPVLFEVIWNGSSIQPLGKKFDIDKMYGIKPFERNKNAIPLENVPIKDSPRSEASDSNAEAVKPAIPQKITTAKKDDSQPETTSTVNKPPKPPSQAALMAAWKDLQAEYAYPGVDTVGINAVETKDAKGTTRKQKIWEIFQRFHW